MSVWEALELLNTLVDESYPDVSGPSSGILTLTIFSRRVLNISFRLPRTSEEMVNRNGCR